MDIDANTLQLAALILGGVELRLAVSKLRRDVDTLTSTKADKPSMKGRLVARGLLLVGAASLLALSACGVRVVDVEKDADGAVRSHIELDPLAGDVPAPTVPESQP